MNLGVCKCSTVHLQMEKRTYIGLNPPIPVEIFQSWMSVEEAAVPSAHMTITNHPSLSHSDRTQIFKTIHESSFINPVRQGPVLFRDRLVVALG